MVNLQLYIEGRPVELFDDESVSITQTIQNVKDISKIFTDFSKTFNVPASKENNKIFEHFYNYDIVGFNAGVKKTAEIYLNHKLFKKGKVKLEGVSLKGNKAHTYRLTFFGDTVNLKDLVSTDDLGALDVLYNIDFDYTPDNVVTYLQNGLDVTIDGVSYPDAVIVPLITHTQRLYYDSSAPAAQSGNLHYDAGTIQGVKYEQLKPAVRVYVVLKAIEKKYGIRFSGDFFNVSNSAFYNLYLWMHRKEGGILEESNIRAQAGSFGRLRGTADDRATWAGRVTTDSFRIPTPDNPKNVRYRYHISVFTQSTDYNIIVEKDGEEYERLDNQSGNITIGSHSKDHEIPPGTYRVYFESEASASFQLEIILNDWTKKFLGSDNKTVTFSARAATTTTASFQVSGQTPKIKVLDLITGLFKMFNLTAYQDDTGQLVVLPLNEYYDQSAQSFDITNYLDTTESNVDSLMPYRRISFGYKGTESFFSENHRELFGSTWAEEKYDGNSRLEGDTYEIELPFEHHKFERLLDHDGTTTTAQWGWSVDVKQETYLGDPLLFYAIRITSGTQIGVLKSSSNRVGVTEYYIPSNSVDVTDSQNINFKAEVNEYDFSTFNKTLYKTYYDEYISDTFNIRRRLSKFTAYLPLRILTKFTLADRFIISNNVYKINSITTNLTTGKSDLELINQVENIIIPDQDKYFADVVDKNIITVDTDKVTVDWNGSI